MVPFTCLDRLKKDLHVFHVMCKVLLSFFAKFGTKPNEDAACDGKTVKMFSHLIRKCFDDDDFVSGKQETKLFGCMYFNFTHFFPSICTLGSF